MGYDIFHVTYSGGIYILVYHEHAETMPVPEQPTTIDNPDLVGVIVLDGVTGQYLDGCWTTDDHRRNFLRGRRSR
jgi:hypothetical protein